MNSQVITVASGKGGTGKSTLCTMVGACLAQMHKKVLIIELGSGLRSLDIMHGLQDTAVFALCDILHGRADCQKVLLQSCLHVNLFIIPGSLDKSFIPEPEAFKALIAELGKTYEYIFLDCPGGVGEMVSFATDVSERAVMVLTPDLLSVRTAQSLAGVLRGIPASIVINKVSPRFKPTPAIPDLDAVMDMVGLPLLGVVPEDVLLQETLCSDQSVPLSRLTLRGSLPAFSNIAARLTGKYVPLAVG